MYFSIILFECIFAKSVAAEQQSVGIVWNWTSHIPVNIHLCEVLTEHKAVSLQTYEQAVSRVNDVARFGVVACPECLEADCTKLRYPFAEHFGADFEEVLCIELEVLA